MASYILNWKSGLGNVTLSPTSSISIPKQDGSGNIDFVVLKYDEDDNPVYLLDDDGYKVPSGYQPYFTTAAGDSILIEGFPPGSLPDGVFSYALNLTTIRLGAGSDRLRLFGKGIVQTARTDVSLDSAAGYVFQSSIFAEDGDDYISPLMPWQSVFKGGANTAYANLVLSDSLTLEEVPYGDTIQLKGSRADWDLEFKDGNGDGDVSLASILDERDYIATSNNNRISGFERLLFGDILFDLILYKQLASSAIYGQPEYNLFGNEVAPSLNSSIKGDLWESFRFSRTRMGGAQGTAAAPITIRTGLGADTPTFGIDKDQTLMAGPNGGPAIQYVNFYTEDANDILELGNIENSVVDTGAGEDAVNLRGTARYTRFYGGTGSTDTLSLPKDQKSYGFSVLTDSATGKTYFRDPNNNEYRDIELYVFSDLTITAADFVSLLTVAPEPPVIGPNIGGDTITTPNPLTPDLWVQGSYDNKVYRGLAGTEVRRMVVSTGDANNRINLSDAIAFADVQTGNGDDVVRVDVYESRDKPFVQQGRAVYRSTINTGAGKDIVNAQAISNSGAYVVDDPLLGPEYQIPDYYQSSIDLGTDDDFIYAFLPYASTFKGGTGVDEILLYGTRSDWDFEFQYKVDGSLDYIVAGGVRGYNVADQNRIYSDFEYIQFNDIRANLANPPVDASADALGQDLLIRTLPELNSTVTAGLWDALAFNRLSIQAVRGTAARRVNIQTGAGADTPVIGLDSQGKVLTQSGGLPSVQYAELSTGADDDVVKIASIDQSSIDLGEGNNVLEIRGAISNTDIRGVGGQNTLFLPLLKSEYGLYLDGDVIRDRSGNAYRGLTDQSEISFKGDKFSVGDLKKQLPGKDDNQPVPPYQDGYISRIGWKGDVTSQQAVEASGKTTLYKVDNEKAVKKVYNEAGILVEVPDVSLSATGGYGYWAGRLVASEGADEVNVKAFGHVAPTFAGGFKPTYSYPDYYKAIVETKGGDDKIYGYFPYASSFDGGAGWDSILLYGKREDFKLSLKAVDGVDVIADANGNTYKSIESFKFGDQDISFDDLKKLLTVAPEPPVIGPDTGSDTITNPNPLTPELWVQGSYDNKVYRGLAGSEVRRMIVSTGDANNRINLSDAIAFADVQTGNGDDVVRVDVYESRDTPFVQHGRAVYRSTISTGGGRDVVNAQAIGNSGDYVVFDPLQLSPYGDYQAPDYYQSSIDLGADDDFIYGFVPYASTFKGGTGVDEILLYGTRSDWDLEFHYKGDGSLDYIVAGGVRGYNVADQNRIYSDFEYIQFNDIRASLANPPVDASADALGQDLLIRTLPELNSSVTAGLWDALAFNRLSIQAVRGTAARRVNIQTGAGADTPVIGLDSQGKVFTQSGGLPSVQYADISTGADNDVVKIASIDQSSIDLGEGNNVLEIRGAISNTDIRGGGGKNTLLLPLSKNEYGLFLDGDVIRDKGGNAYRGFSDQSELSFNGDKSSVGDLKKQLPGKDDNQSIPPYQDGYISRIGWKGDVTSQQAFEASGKTTLYKIDNEKAVKKVFNEAGILVEVPDLSLSATGGYGYWAGRLVASEGADEVNVKAFGHVAPTYSGGFKPTYSYPDYYKAIVETKGGDDRIFGYFPYASFFDGGAGWDSILLYGKREDFKLALKAVDGVDVISDANGNTYRNIESFQFGDQDISFDDLKKQLATKPDLPNGGGSSEDLFASVVSAFQTPLDAMMLVIGGKYSLPEIRDYDGILHGGASKSVDGDYGFQGFVDVQGDGRKEAVYTNQKSARFVTARVDSFTGQISYPDYGRNGSTRVVGRYIDPLVAEGEAHGGFLLSGEKAPQRGGPHDSQTRFTEDLRRGNLILKAAKDFDADGYQEMYWKLRDGSAYMRGLMHKDGNIQYVNYQSEAQMTDYLSRTGNSALLNYIVY
ncbi:MAG: hypothetical protein ACK55H_10215 [Cyanobacteriota bacterium]